MIRMALLLAVWVVIAGCAWSPVSRGGVDAQLQLNELRAIDALPGDALIADYEQTLELFRQNPTPRVSWRLAYLLSRPELPMADLARSRAMFMDLPGQPLSELMVREIELRMRLEQSHALSGRLAGEIAALRDQLDALKTIEEDLSEGKNDFEALSQ